MNPSFFSTNIKPAQELKMPDEQKGLETKDWSRLLRRIKDQKCTPFIGSGACLGKFKATEIAKNWAHNNNYPLNNPDNLVSVAQFLAVTEDPIFPKERIGRLFSQITPPDFRDPDEPHRVLANLPIPVYITSNYDDFLVQAIRSRYREPKQEICRWNKSLDHLPSIFETEVNYKPTVANPLVFHLHGHINFPESLVLAEDEFLDFLVNISRDGNLLPATIQKALAGTTLLFLGYKRSDRDFRILLRCLDSYIKKMEIAHVAVQLIGDDISEDQKIEAQDYLERYFGKLNVKIYWGTCQEFVIELRNRWEDYESEE